MRNYYDEAEQDLRNATEDPITYKQILLRAMTNIMYESETSGTTDKRLLAFMGFVIDYLYEFE